MKKPADIRIGISGWTYGPWHGVFYPKKLPHAHDLEYASRQFNSIEINGSFYSLQRAESYLNWYEATPEGFLFSVKANRYITHIRRLREIEAPLGNFFGSGILALMDKLGPILWQFPPNFKYDPKLFSHFLELLPHDTSAAARFATKHADPWIKDRGYFETDKRRPLRHAVEVRNESFRDDGFFDLLEKNRVALVASHSSDAWPYFEELTSDFCYARLHGEGELYSGGYGERALNEWAERVRKWSSGRTHRDVFLYFDNDAKVRAPFDAMELYEKVTGAEYHLKSA